ncbi:MAG: hypothetical protein OEY64_03480 [Nitrospinota bacterium]|nr:hypothetical protein [Nitrospinota bacterium]
MKILFMQKKQPDKDMKEIIEALEKEGDVTKIDLNSEKDYAKIIELIDASDKIVSW